MKIEIAESLIYSYLKHKEGCRIIQTNWRTSGKWVVTEYETVRARTLFNKISESEHFKGIFKKSSFNQLIKQAEIDVLGINTAESTIYGIDIAFHHAGINYGNKTETVSRIIKKIFRTIFIMQSYFNENEKFNSYFVTPKANPAEKLLIDEHLIKAREVINDENISIEFIANDQFYEVIVDSLLENFNDEHDTSELFSRAIKLLNLDNRKKNIIRKTEIKSQNTSRLTIIKRTENGMKIGQFVQYSFRKAYEQGLITPNEINKLQNPEYSKQTFDSNFSILKNKNKEITDENGRTRYYAKETFCGNYHLSSQWYESQWDLLLNWLKKIGFNYRHNAP